MGKKIHHSVFINWAGIFIKIGTGLFLLPFIVRALGVDSYGEYVFLAAIFGYSEMLEFGLRAAILRYTGNLSGSGDYGALNKVLGTAFSYYSVAALVVLSAGLVLYFSPPEVILPAEASARFPLYAGLFATVAATTFFRIGWVSVLQGHERYDLVNLVDLAGFLMRAGLIVLFLNSGYGLVAVILADLFNNLFTAAGSRIALHRIAPGVRLDLARLRGEELKGMLSYSGWAFLNSLAFQFSTRGPSVIVGGAVSTSAAGYFGIASRLRSYVYQLGTAMNAPLRARATVLVGQGNADNVAGIMIRSTRFLALLAIILCVPLFVYAEAMLSNWMGPEFGPSAVVLRILLVGLVGEVSVLMIGGALYATGDLRNLAIVNMVEAVLVLGLSYGLAKTYGLIGATCGVAIPIAVNKFAVQPLVLLRPLRVSAGAWWRQSMLRPLIVLLLGSGPVLLLKWLWSPQNILVVLLHLALATALMFCVAWLVALDPAERSVVTRKLNSIVRRGR